MPYEPPPSFRHTSGPSWYICTMSIIFLPRPLTGLVLQITA